MIFEGISPLGIGTNRLPIKGANDIEGLEYSADLLASALNMGASYIDVAYSYSKGMAETACKMAFQRTGAPRHVTIKSSYLMERTSDDVLRKTETSLLNMGLESASYFVVWNISSYEQFLKIMQKNSLYDGAIRARERGLIQHICFSTHAPVNDIIKIINSQAFESVTLSFSALNSDIMDPVLECASQKNTEIVVMNPLGGGIIPQNKDYYAFLKNEEEKSTVQAALRFVYAFPAVKIVLSGLSSFRDLEENIQAFGKNQNEHFIDRISRVKTHIHSIQGFCTGCRYCDGCPKQIKIYELMQAYNSLLIPGYKNTYHCLDAELQKNIGICSILKNTFSFLPETHENPCIQCGACEKKCTAKISITRRLDELYRRFETCGFSRQSMFKRIKTIIGSSQKIAFYPGGGYTAFVITLLNELYENIDFDISIFDSNPNVWGTKIDEIPVMNPEKILDISPEKIIISNYIYSNEIYASLEYLKQRGTCIIQLHLPQDVPWVF